jgi:hypothetical protein
MRDEAEVSRNECRVTEVTTLFPSTPDTRHSSPVTAH